MSASSGKRGLFVYCPNPARHRLIHARLGASPTARGGMPALLIMARTFDWHGESWSEGGAFLELARDGRDVPPLIVSCICGGGTEWTVSAEAIARGLASDARRREVRVTDLL